MSHAEVLFTPVVVPPRPESRWPVYKTMGYTLSISVRFLASSFVGKGTIARCDELLDWYWRSIFASGDATLRREGTEQLESGGPFVFMSNHSSILDIPSLMGACPGSLRMVTKEELTKVPLWGRALLASGFIPIDRRDREKAIKQLELAKERMRQGVNIWVAPEGTRSRTGELGPFKKGGFHTALSIGAPIVPTWIDGASEIIPPDQFIVRYGGTVTVRFGTPIPTADRSRDDIESLMADVRAAIVSLSGGKAAR